MLSHAPESTSARATCGRPNAPPSPPINCACTSSRSIATPRPCSLATICSPRRRRATSSGSHSPSEAVEWQCRSMCGVVDLGGGPRRLRLTEQIEQLALGELGEGAIGRASPERREARDAAAALRPSPLLEDETELIPPVHGQAARGIDLPTVGVHGQSASRHERYACDVVVTGTSLHRSQASGAYVASAWSRRSSWISSGSREAWARCDISVGLSENSMNSRGSLAFRNSQMR